MRTKACSRCTSRSRCNRRSSNVTKKFLNAYWNRAWKSRKSICGLIWKEWSRVCALRWRTGGSSRLIGISYPPMRPTISKSFFARIRARCWRYWLRKTARLVEARDNPDHPSNDLRFIRDIPRLRQAPRQRVWLHHQLRSGLVEPAAAVTVSDLHKVHRAIVLVDPIGLFHASHRHIDQHDASRPQQRHHATVIQADVAIAVMVVASRERTLEASPFLDHPRQELRSIRVKRGVEMHRNTQRRRRRHQMALRRMKNGRVAEKFIDRHVVPAKNVERVEMINDRQSIDFVQTRDDAVVFDVRQAADVQDELRTAALGRKFKAGPFHITIGQPKLFADLTETKAGDHVFLGEGKIVSEGYNTSITLLKNRNKHFESHAEKVLFSTEQREIERNSFSA